LGAALRLCPRMSCMVCDKGPLRLVTRTMGMLASMSLLLLLHRVVNIQMCETAHPAPKMVVRSAAYLLTQAWSLWRPGQLALLYVWRIQVHHLLIRALSFKAPQAPQATTWTCSDGSRWNGKDQNGAARSCSRQHGTHTLHTFSRTQLVSLDLHVNMGC